MSMNSSVQQLASGLAAFVSGHLLGQAPGGQITHYPVIGAISVTCALLCIYLTKFLKSAEGAAGLVEALPVEG